MDRTDIAEELGDRLHNARNRQTDRQIDKQPTPRGWSKKPAESRVWPVVRAASARVGASQYRTQQLGQRRGNCPCRRPLPTVPSWASASRSGDIPNHLSPTGRWRDSSQICHRFLIRRRLPGHGRSPGRAASSRRAVRVWGWPRAQVAPELSHDIILRTPAAQPLSAMGCRAGTGRNHATTSVPPVNYFTCFRGAGIRWRQHPPGQRARPTPTGIRERVESEPQLAKNCQHLSDYLEL